MSGAALRESQAAVALIRARHETTWTFLCHWSGSWRALHFVGGHREPGETFRACAVREACEELGVAACDVSVEAEPLGHLEYVTHSRSAGVPTAYVIEVFPAALAPGAVLGRPEPENRWVTRAEIRAGVTADGTPVSPTAELILSKLNL